MNAPVKPPAPIAFIDLKAQRERIGPKLTEAIVGAVEAGQYIMGPQVKALEAKLAAFAGTKHALTCANGTDAILLPLMAWGIGAGDAVFCPSFTFAATAEVVALVGASPVFVDIRRDTFNLDPACLDAAIEMVKAEGKLVPRAVIVVDLFGQPADYPAIASVAQKHGLKLIADSAQGFGGNLAGRHPAHWADVTTTSFFPAKPLGCYGDGGAILTDDGELMDTLISLRVHGQATKRDIERSAFAHDPKYLNVRIGLNSRLDTIQAAVLLEKLAIFPSEIEARNRVAARYNAALRDVAEVPAVIEGGVSTWAQYTLKVDERDGLIDHLKVHGVPTAVYYPIPLHKQLAYIDYPICPGGLPVSELLVSQVLSLPMHPYLEESVQDYIVDCVLNYSKRRT